MYAGADYKKDSGKSQYQENYGILNLPILPWIPFKVARRQLASSSPPLSALLSLTLLPHLVGKHSVFVGRRLLSDHPLHAANMSNALNMSNMENPAS